MPTKSEMFLEAFKVFSENYAKPFLSNPKVTTALLLIVLVRLGFDVAGYLGLGKEKIEIKPEPAPVIRTVPDPAPEKIIVKESQPQIIYRENKYDDSKVIERLNTLEKQVKKNTGKINDVHPLHY